MIVRRNCYSSESFWYFIYSIPIFQKLYGQVHPSLARTWAARSLSSYSVPEGTALSKQNELKRYPVPPLKDTLSKYLQSVVPFVNRDDYEKTCRLANELGREGGDGQKLQKLLEERSQSMENWVGTVSTINQKKITSIEASLITHQFIISLQIGGWIEPTWAIVVP